MANKTISLPDDVVPIIEKLDMPFSRWVTQQLRRHAAQTELPLEQQLLADARLADTPPPSRDEATSTGQRMQQSAPW